MTYDLDMLKSTEEYLRSLKDGRVIYYDGKRVEDVTTHKALGVAVKHASDLYLLQQDEKYRQITVSDSAKHGKISSFFKIPVTSEDLEARFNLIYKTTEYGRGIFNIVKAIGSDAIFALMISSYRVDRKYGTQYSSRIAAFYDYVAENDLSLAVAQTDVKGDRMKRPSEQSDPDMYVRIVGKSEAGITVRGAKAHTTQSVAANELIVIPSRNMQKNEADYAVAFAVSPSAPGVKMISKPLKSVEDSNDNSEMVIGANNAETETITIFDDVFVPWDRVFLAGEWDFAGLTAIMFPTFHRFTAIAYRSAMASLLIGLSKLLAETNGVSGASHIRRDIVDLIMYKETLRSAGISASHNAICDSNRGICAPNTVFTNTGKLYANIHYTDIIRSAVDVAGGLAATLPSSADMKNPETSHLLKKYLVGSDDRVEERFKLLNTMKYLISSLNALFTTAMLHAEGSIEASVIELFRSYDYSEDESLALYASGIHDALTGENK